jgi:general secretion pathway protein L
MADFLVLRFADMPTDPVEWLIVDQSGAPHGVIEHGDLQDAARAAQGKRVIALVPGTNVLRTFVEIPIRNQAKLMQAIPFAMEDLLAGNIDDLHFAAGKRDESGRLPVAAVQRLKMEAWLEQISAVELDLLGVYTDGDALGDMPNTTILLVEEQRATIRSVNGHIASSDLVAIDALIDLWLTRHRRTDDEELPPPINLLLYVTPDCEETLQPIIDRLRPQVETFDIMTLPDGGLPRMAAQSVVSPGINLLQGSYAPRSTLSAYWPVWRLSAALLAGLCSALLVSKILEISQLKRQAEGLDQSIEQALRYAFPEISEVRDARALFDSKLRSMGNVSSAASGTGFLSTLDSVAGAVAALKESTATIESISYRSGAMELKVAAPNVETLDKIRASISQGSGLQAEIQSANPDGEMIRGRLQIKPAGS